MNLFRTKEKPKNLTLLTMLFLYEKSNTLFRTGLTELSTFLGQSKPCLSARPRGPNNGVYSHEAKIFLFRVIREWLKMAVAYFTLAK